MSLPPKDHRTWKVGDRGDLTVPREFLEAAGFGAKMFVRFRIDGKAIVIERASPEANPLDGKLGKKLDQDIFSKVLGEQEREKQRLREKFEKGLAESKEAGDVEPPDHPFRYD